MKIQLLTSPLYKGEKWENDSKREIEITESVDNRGSKPFVYLGVFKETKTGTKITEDFFLTPQMARKIGSALIRQAEKTKKNGTLSKRKK